MATLKLIMVTVLTILAVSIGYFEFAGSLMEAYDVEVTGNFTQTENIIRSSFNSTEEIANTIQTQIKESGGINVFSGVAILSKTALAGIKLPFQLIAILGTLLTEVSNVIGLPTWAFALSISIILVLITFAVYSAVLRTPNI